MRRAAVVALLALSLVACRRTGPDGRAKPDWRVIQLYGGAGSVQALIEPASVEVFDIDPLARAPEPGVAFCGVHRVTGGPYLVSTADAEAFSAVLRNPETYDWRKAKGDPFRPTVGLRFTRDVSRVDLALDLESRMLTVHRQGRRIGVEDFDDAEPAIREILDRVVPQAD